MQKLTDATIDELVKGQPAVILEFVSAWCSTCSRLEQQLEAISGELAGRVAMARIDITESPETAQRFDVLGIPTLVFIRDAEHVGQVALTGGASDQKIRQLIQDHLGV